MKYQLPVILTTNYPQYSAWSNAYISFEYYLLCIQLKFTENINHLLRM